MAKHTNTDHCAKCEEIILKYGGLFYTLKDWFDKIRIKYPEAHISCAGRNEKDQQEAFARGMSKATFGKSPHNYVPTPALDLFRLDKEGKASWDKEWYKLVIGENLETNLSWGGNWQSFRDNPHVEISNWRFLRDSEKISLIKKS